MHFYSLSPTYLQVILDALLDHVRKDFNCTTREMIWNEKHLEIHQLAAASI